MFKKTIKYTDFNGEEQEKDFWFHLSNAKLAVISAGGNDMKARAERMIKAKDNVAILDELRSLIRMSCGIRSDDGQRFIQTPEAQSELLDSPAFDELLFELFVGNNAAQFFAALVPPEQQKQIEELAKKQGLDPLQNPPNPPSIAQGDKPAWFTEGRVPTEAELVGAPKELLMEAYRRKLSE